MKHRTRRRAGVRAAQTDLIGFDHRPIAGRKTRERDVFYSAVQFLRMKGVKVQRRANFQSQVDGRLVEDRMVGEIARAYGWTRDWKPPK